MAKKFLIFDGKREWWLDRFDVVAVGSLLSALVLAGEAQKNLFPARPGLAAADIARGLELDASAVTVAVLIALYVVLMPALALLAGIMKARARQPLAARVYSMVAAFVLLLVLLQSWTHVSFGTSLDRMLTPRHAAQTVDELWSAYDSGRIPEQAYLQACLESVEADVAAGAGPVQCFNPLAPARRLQLEPSEAGVQMARYRLDLEDNIELARQLLWMQAVIALLFLLPGLWLAHAAIRTARQHEKANEKSPPVEPGADS